MRFKKIIVLALVLIILIGTIPSAQCAEAKEDYVPLPIIMYHHIHRDSTHWGEFTVSEATLEGDLKYFKDNGFESITVKQLIDYTKGTGDLPEKPILITFDDGHESFLVYAVPLLEKYGMSAVMAIVGSFAESETDTALHNVSYSYLNWAQLSELSKNPCVELQNHSYAMHYLSPRRGCRIMPGENPENYRQALTDDIRRNEQLFIEFTGERPVSFAYPYGHECPEAKDILKSLGYEVLFNCYDKVNKIYRDPECLLDLGRYNRPNNVAREKIFSAFQ